jgi:hypothetical protein
MSLLRRVVGPQPVLRLIALLLAIVVVLLVLILQEVKDLYRVTPSIDCGDTYAPCKVEVTNQRY